MRWIQVAVMALVVVMSVLTWFTRKNGLTSC
jgi:hypothetical protein